MAGLLFPKPPSRALAALKRRVKRKLVQRSLYKLVNARDGYRCRGCRRRLSLGGCDIERTLHHHHIQFRSQGGNDTMANVVSLCGLCHADVHAHRLTIAGTNANGRLRFERAA